MGYTPSLKTVFSVLMVLNQIHSIPESPILLLWCPTIIQALLISVEEGKIIFGYISVSKETVSSFFFAEDKKEFTK